MMTNRHDWRTAWALGAALAVAIGGASAAAAQDLMGTRALAMGGTLRAAPAGDSAILLNPAGLALTKSYTINGMYLYRASDAGSLMNISIVDSVKTRVAAGLSYSYGHATPELTIPLGGGKLFALKETINTHEVALAAAYPFAQVFHVGMTAKYAYQSFDQPEDTPEAARKSTAKGFTLDAGAVLRPFPALNIAAVGYNLVPVDDVVFPRLLGLGVSYAFGTLFLAEFDTVLNFSAAEKVKASYHGGGELFLGGSYALRGGIMHDTLRDATYAAGGLGLVASKIALDVGLRQMVSGGAETVFATSLRLFLNAM
jgi:hypothetical protein